VQGRLGDSEGGGRSEKTIGPSTKAAPIERSIINCPTP
jgi:hypothetical protein